MAAVHDVGRILLFADLDPEAQEALAAVAGSKSCEDGQVVMLEGDDDTPVFFVLEGAVRVFRTNLDGREQTLIRLCEGDAFNMPSAFTGQTTHASAEAVGTTRLLAVTREDFVRVATETPQIARAVLRDLSLKLGHLTELSHDLGLRSVRARLARFLLAHGQQPQEDPPVRWTHEAIAAQIGTVREMVSRTLRAFVRDGLVEMRRHQIVVRDAEALAQEALE
ncbi:MAG: Crp/Fnr family transcriptional regulator [Anaerolineae bacterium]|nr:Crp/Fnr family transcriptional regulator [Anaerolineae bacterium]